MVRFPRNGIRARPFFAISQFQWITSSGASSSKVTIVARLRRFACKVSEATMHAIMGRFLLRSSFATLATALVLFSACSSSKSPTGTSTSCGDANVHCVYATLQATDWRTSVTYLGPTYDVTDYVGAGYLETPNIPDVSPGDEITLNITLSPPIVVTSNVPSLVALQFVGLLDNVNTYLYMTADASVSLRGDWTNAEPQPVSMRGIGRPGYVEHLLANVNVSGLSEGDELKGISLRFTMPEVWSDSTAIALDRTFPFNSFNWSTELPGDTSGDIPPIQLKAQ